MRPLERTRARCGQALPGIPAAALGRVRESPPHGRRAAVLSCLVTLLAPVAMTQQESLQSYTQNGSSSTSRHGFDYLSEVGHIMDFGAAGDGSTDDSAAFQDALNACGLNFGTLEITQPTVGTGGTINYLGGYFVRAGTTYTTPPNPPPPLIWGTGASCRVIVKKGAMISGSLPPPDAAHIIIDENLQSIDPWASTAIVPLLSNSNPLGFIAVTSSQGQTATLSPSSLTAGAPPFGTAATTFAVHGEDAALGATDTAAGPVSVGPGRSTGAASNSAVPGVIVQVDSTGASGTAYNQRYSAWSFGESAGSLSSLISSQTVGTAASPIGDIYTCPVNCTYAGLVSVNLTLTSSGSGYANGDTISIIGAGLAAGAVVTISSVSSGHISMWSVTTRGHDYSPGLATTSAITGTGSGATFTINAVATGYVDITGTSGLNNSHLSAAFPNNSGTITVAPYANAGDIAYNTGSGGTISVLGGNTATGTQLLTEGSSGTPSWATVGGQAAIVAPVPINTSGTSQLVLTAPSPAGKTGTVYRLRGTGSATSSAASTNHICLASTISSDRRQLFLRVDDNYNSASTTITP